MVCNPAYYIDEFADEVMPHDLEDCSLEGWATWIAKGGDADECGWKVETPDSPKLYKAERMDFESDIVASYRPPTDERDGGVVFSRPVPDGAFVAVRWAKGAGWWADHIYCDDRPLGDWLREEMDLGEGEEYFLAIGHTQPVALLFDPRTKTLTPANKTDAG